MPAPEENEPSTVGWDAIDQALAKVYGDQEPKHMGTLLPFSLGGNDPLDGISIYRSDRGGAPHWHYVSYGMSELYVKESKDLEFSGYGFEFTFRLKMNPNQSEPPSWPCSLLQNLARYVFSTGNVFATGHHLPLNGPIALGQDTLLHAAMFAQDSELKTIFTPHGKVEFLQLVGMTMDELAAGRAWNTEKVLSVLQQNNPLLITDLSRASLLNDARSASLIEEGAARDGSSTSSFMIPKLDIFRSGSKTIWQMGAAGVRDVKALLRGRIIFGKPFVVLGEGRSVSIKPGEHFELQSNLDKAQLELTLPASFATKLENSLQPRRGDYELAELPNLVIRIVPTEIRDSTGKKVVEVIG